MAGSGMARGMEGGLSLIAARALSREIVAELSRGPRRDVTEDIAALIVKFTSDGVPPGNAPHESFADMIPDAVEAPPSTKVVSSVRVEYGTHDRVRVWNRGALAGELVVTQGDADAFVELLSRGMCKDRGACVEALKAAAHGAREIVNLIPACDGGTFDVGHIGDLCITIAVRAEKAAQYIEDRVTKGLLAPNEKRPDPTPESKL